MSSTRHAPPGELLRQNRFASSPEFERGLVGSLVAKRCSVLRDPQDRELVWNLQYLSHVVGLRQLVPELLNQAGKCLGTSSMVAVGKAAGESYNSDQARKIRGELPPEYLPRFPLPGESVQALEAEALCARFGGTPAHRWRVIEDARLADEGSTVHPSSYPVGTFLDLCRSAAVAPHQDIASGALEYHLSEMCLNPAACLDGPWYFRGLIPVLRQLIATRSAGVLGDVVKTSVVQAVHNTLDYCHAGKCLTIINGRSRIGQSFGAETWCEANAGRGRCAEVPPGSDDGGFFRALGRSLGLSVSLNYKAVQIRHQVESILAGGDLMLVLNRAHNLFPQKDIRYAVPTRINWVTSMVERGAPMCLVADPVFFAALKMAERQTYWSSARLSQLVGRCEDLPNVLTRDELAGVVRAEIPCADAESVNDAVDYAQGSGKQLAGIRCVVSRARYLAGLRNESVTYKHVRAAIGFLLPGDMAFARALSTVEKSGRRGHQARVTVDLPDTPAVTLDSVQRQVRPRSGTGALLSEVED